MAQVPFLQVYKYSPPDKVPQQPKQYTYSTLSVVAVPLGHTVASSRVASLHTRSMEEAVTAQAVVRMLMVVI